MAQKTYISWQKVNAGDHEEENLGTLPVSAAKALAVCLMLSGRADLARVETQELTADLEFEPVEQAVLTNFTSIIQAAEEAASNVGFFNFNPERQRFDFMEDQRALLNKAVAIGFIDAVELACLVSEHRWETFAKLRDALTQAAYSNVHCENGRAKHSEWCKANDAYHAGRFGAGAE